MFLGITGSGKSRLVKTKLRAWGLKGARIVVVDLDDEYSRHGQQAPDVYLGTLRERMTARELAQFPGKVLEPKLSLAVVPDDDTPAAAARAFELVSKLCRAAKKPVILVVEEVGFFASHAQEQLKAVATRYRKYGVAMICVSQRAAQVPLTVRSQTSELFCFSQSEPADLDALAEKFGRPFSERVSRLPLGSFEGWRAQPSSSTPGEE